MVFSNILIVPYIIVVLDKLLLVAIVLKIVPKGLAFLKIAKSSIKCSLEFKMVSN